MTTELRSAARRLLGEPLVQFLALGAVLVLVFQWRGGGAPTSRRIVITPGHVSTLAAGFARTWQRPPSGDELRALVDDHVREEIAVREAMAAGLDRDDTVIRRRLRQKWEFVQEDGVDDAPPSEAELAAWLDAHPDAYRVEPQVSFRQVTLTSDRHGAALEADARGLLEQLGAAGPDADIESLGELRSLPADMELSALADVAGLFGDDFARALAEAEPGRWTGPIRSSFGLHVVLIRERVGGGVPPLADVRAAVERDVVAARRDQHVRGVYDDLLSRYDVIIEPPPAPATQGAPR